MEVSGFPHQVGGHFGLLKCCNHVCKPYNYREFLFYMQMDPSLRSFTATCCGRVKVNLSVCNDGLLHMSTDSSLNCFHLSPFNKNYNPSKSKEKVCTDFSTSTSLDEEIANKSMMTFRIKSGKVEAEQTNNLWAGQCQSKVVQKLLKENDKSFILLEDIVSEYEYPCVIDLKMGTRQHGDDASAQKQISQTQKCKESTSGTMGIRLVGMQLYQIQNNRFIYVNKYEGRRMNRSKLCLILQSFFMTAGRDRLTDLIEQLNKLRLVLQNALSYRFFSSSILIAFDGGINLTNPTEKVQFKEAASKKIIDDSNFFKNFENQNIFNMDDKPQDSSKSTIFDSEDEESSISNLSFTDQISDNFFPVNKMHLDNLISLKNTFDPIQLSPGNNKSTDKKSKILLKMIDFAHSTFNGFLEDKVYEGVDDGYLLGIDSLIEIVTSVYKIYN